MVVNFHFVNSHIVNYHLVNFPLCQFPFGQLPPLSIPICRAANLMSETYQKNEWDGGLQEWDMLMEIKYCGSSTVTNNKQKHSQNAMVNIFTSGCYAHYIHYNSCTTLLSHASPGLQSSVFRSARRFCIIVHCGVSVCSCTWMLALVNCIRNILHAWCMRSRL